jgi:hypothetical protein
VRGDSTCYYVKHFFNNTPREQLKSLFRDKALEEFRSCEALRALPVEAVEFLSHGRRGRERFLVSNECAGITAQTMWESLRCDSDARDTFIGDLVSFICTLFANTIFHPDLHMGNLLCRHVNGRVIFVLIDVYGIAVRDLRPRDKAKMLAPLRSTLPFLDLSSRSGLWRRLGEAGGMSAGEIRSQAYAHWRRNAARMYRKRRSKYLSSSSIVDVVHCGSDTLRFVAGRDSEAVTEAVHLHRSAASSGALLKLKKKRSINRWVAGDLSLVTKGFRLDGLSERFARDTRSWLNGFRLCLHSIPCVAYLGWVRDGRQGFIVMDDIGPRSLDVEFAEFAEDRKRLKHRLEQLGLLAAHLHEMGVWFKDLKTSNIHIHAESDQLLLLDLDNVTFPRTMAISQVTRNLQVLYASLPPCIIGPLRARALTAYAADRGLSRSEYRSLYNGLNFSYDH